jgi:hypothetical protein
MSGVPGSGQVVPTRTAAIRRITEGRSRWRVLVETWEEPEMCRGRLLFRPDDVQREDAERGSAALLHGRSHEDVYALAYDLPEDRLRRVLMSLS